MASQEHLDILKQGVDVWNEWRKEHPDAKPDLRRASLTRLDLKSANLNGTQFKDSVLSMTDLSLADLVGASFEGTILHEAILNKADLRSADLRRTDFSRADLTGANLKGVILYITNFNSSILDDADLTDAKMSNSIFMNTDLRLVKGLKTVNHFGPSDIGINTIYRSQGNIPENFLIGAGVPTEFLIYMHSLSKQPIEYYSCFISYSSRDEDFAKRLYADLQSNGVRCWFAPEDLKIGDKIRPRIDESIRLHDKLLLVLSEYSTASQWVEQEVATALARERKEQRIVLFPIRLDNAIMEMESDWPFLIRNTRNIGDFTQWKNHDSYQAGFDRLLRDLKATP